MWTQAYKGELRGRHGEMWQFRSTDFAAVARDTDMWVYAPTAYLPR